MIYFVILYNTRKEQINKRNQSKESHSMKSMKGLVTLLTHWKGLIKLAKSMVCLTPFISRWVECIARLLSALSPCKKKSLQ